MNSLNASSSTTSTVRVLVLFYLAAPNDSSSARTSLIHKEKFSVPLSGDEHKDLFNFVRHLKTFTGLAEIAKDLPRVRASEETPNDRARMVLRG